MEHGTQVRCRDCATGWVTVDSQDEVPSASVQRCEACLRTSNSQRAERRAQDPKPIGRPPKQVRKKSNRGWPPKSDLRDRFGDSLHVRAQIEDDDGDELAAPPPAPPPVPRRRGRPPKERPDNGGGDELAPAPPPAPPAPQPAPRRRGRPPKQRPDTGDRGTARPL